MDIETDTSSCSDLWETTWLSPPKRIPIYPIIGVTTAIIAIIAATVFFAYHIWTEPSCTSPSSCRICGKQGMEVALGHNWVDATCISPQTCMRCSEVSGEPMGHIWQSATCDMPQICTTCGQQNGLPVGHDWIEATYSNPKQCGRCAQTEGNVKGYIGKVSGTWSNERFYIDDTSSNIYDLEQTIEKCRKFTLTVGVSNVQFGSVYGNWGIFGRNAYGGWDELGQFELFDDEISVTFEYETPITFDAIAVLPYESYFGNYGKRISLTEVQVNVD